MEDAELAAAIELSLGGACSRAPPEGRSEPARGDLVDEFLDLFEHEDSAQVTAASAALAEAEGDVRIAAHRLFYGKEHALEPEPEPHPLAQLEPQLESRTADGPLHPQDASRRLLDEGGDCTRRRAEHKTTAAQLPSGCAVRVTGLKSSSQHNGKHGRILRFDDGKGRYQVELDRKGSGKTVRLLVKPANLSRVEIQEGVPPSIRAGVGPIVGTTGLEPELEPEPEPAPEPKPKPKPKPEAPGSKQDRKAERFPPGCAVWVTGLKSSSQHNGKHGRILKFDDGKGRYQVELDRKGSGKTVRLLVKPANLSRDERPRAADPGSALHDSLGDAACCGTNADSSWDDGVEDIGCTEGFHENLQPSENGR